MLEPFEVRNVYMQCAAKFGGKHETRGDEYEKALVGFWIGGCFGVRRGAGDR